MAIAAGGKSIDFDKGTVTDKKTGRTGKITKSGGVKYSKKSSSSGGSSSRSSSSRSSSSRSSSSGGSSSKTRVSIVSDAEEDKGKTFAGKKIQTPEEYEKSREKSRKIRRGGSSSKTKVSIVSDAPEDVGKTFAGKKIQTPEEYKKSRKIRRSKNISSKSSPTGILSESKVDSSKSEKRYMEVSSEPLRYESQFGPQSVVDKTLYGRKKFQTIMSKPSDKKDFILESSLPSSGKVFGDIISGKEPSKYSEEFKMYAEGKVKPKVEKIEKKKGTEIPDEVKSTEDIMKRNLAVAASDGTDIKSGEGGLLIEEKKGKKFSYVLTDKQKKEQSEIKKQEKEFEKTLVEQKKLNKEIQEFNKLPDEKRTPERAKKLNKKISEIEKKYQKNPYVKKQGNNYIFEADILPETVYQKKDVSTLSSFIPQSSINKQIDKALYKSNVVDIALSGERGKFTQGYFRGVTGKDIKYSPTEIYKNPLGTLGQTSGLATSTVQLPLRILGKKAPIEKMSKGTIKTGAGFESVATTRASQLGFSEPTSKKIGSSTTNIAEIGLSYATLAGPVSQIGPAFSATKTGLTSAKNILQTGVSGSIIRGAGTGLSKIPGSTAIKNVLPNIAKSFKVASKTPFSKRAIKASGSTLKYTAGAGVVGVGAVKGYEGVKEGVSETKSVSGGVGYGALNIAEFGAEVGAIGGLISKGVKSTNVARRLSTEKKAESLRRGEGVRRGDISSTTQRTLSDDAATEKVLSQQKFTVNDKQYTVKEVSKGKISKVDKADDLLEFKGTKISPRASAQSETTIKVFDDKGKLVDTFYGQKKGYIGDISKDVSLQRSQGRLELIPKDKSLSKEIIIKKDDTFLSPKSKTYEEISLTKKTKSSVNEVPKQKDIERFGRSSLKYDPSVKIDSVTRVVNRGKTQDFYSKSKLVGSSDDVLKTNLKSEELRFKGLRVDKSPIDEELNILKGTKTETYLSKSKPVNLKPTKVSDPLTGVMKESDIIDEVRFVDLGKPSKSVEVYTPDRTINNIFKPIKSESVPIKPQKQGNIYKVIDNFQGKTQTTAQVKSPISKGNLVGAQKMSNLGSKTKSSIGKYSAGSSQLNRAGTIISKSLGKQEARNVLTGAKYITEKTPLFSLSPITSQKEIGLKNRRNMLSSTRTSTTDSIFKSSQPQAQLKLPITSQSFLQKSITKQGQGSSSTNIFTPVTSITTPTPTPPPPKTPTPPPLITGGFSFPGGWRTSSLSKSGRIGTKINPIANISESLGKPLKGGKKLF